MKPFLPILPIGTAVAVLAIAGCGSSSNSASSSGSAAQGRATTVSSHQIDGAGTVLVDAKGAALYAPDQERGGKVRCVGACTSIWKPLTLGSGKPTGPGKLGVLRRPDGTRQVTAAGRPLYSFTQEGAGSVTGNGVSDAFGSGHFTWHVIKASGAPAAATGSSNSNSGSSGSSGGASSYGY
jgi:predicted lipoprotein with Yx(FWY)xxD motif